MEYKITKWALSDIPSEEIKDGKNANVFSKEGLTTLKILGADYQDGTAEKLSDRYTYRIRVECIEGGPDAGVQASLTYWLKEKNSPMYSAKTLGTLRSLGRAIFGDSFKDDVPMPDDIIGAVVMGNISLSKPDQMGRVFPRVYEWSMASQDFIGFSDIDQEYRGAADGNSRGEA
jgi:hypothetical protein